MFLFKSKIDPALKDAIKNKYYKKYRVLIKCKSEIYMKSIEKKIKSYSGEIINSIPIINCITSKISSKGIERLVEYPQVEYVCYDNTAILCGTSILSSNGIKHEGSYKLTGKNVCVGLIDSGSYPHPDLLNPKNKLLKFTDLINHYKYAYDDNGHGTFISGLICGSGIASKGMYKGISPDASLYSIKAFNSSGKAQVSDILFALQMLINESEEYNIKIICLPFETNNHNPFTESLFSKLFKKAVEKNIIVIIPSGHNGDGDGSIMGIATLENCITVGGVDTTLSKVTPYKLSSRGPFGKLDKPDLAAAAVDICSLSSNISYVPEKNNMKLYPKTLDNPYTCYSGTSCSAAFVSGLCALLFENNPGLTYKDILSLLKVSCTMLGFSKWAQGSGIVDINKLLP